MYSKNALVNRVGAIDEKSDRQTERAMDSPCNEENRRNMKNAL